MKKQIIIIHGGKSVQKGKSILAVLKKYKEHLPLSKLVIFKEKGHFRMKDFPELVRDIKRLFMV